MIFDHIHWLLKKVCYFSSKDIGNLYALLIQIFDQIILSGAGELFTRSVNPISTRGADYAHYTKNYSRICLCKLKNYQVQDCESKIYFEHYKFKVHISLISDFSTGKITYLEWLYSESHHLA